MPWRTIPGITGKVYQPETAEGGRKHPCEDCFACQNCSRERCCICRKEKAAFRDRGSCALTKEVLE